MIIDRMSNKCNNHCFRLFYALIIFLLTTSSCVNNDSSFTSSQSEEESTSFEDSSYIVDPLMPIIEAINDVYDIDSPDDLSYQITLHDYDFINVEGLGISDFDYSFSDDEIKIYKQFLRHFFHEGQYELTINLVNHQHSLPLPLVFSVHHRNQIHRIINSGFETGDLYGYDTLPIWKNESGLFSFVEERIVTTHHYGSTNEHLYNRDGQYHLGVYQHPYSNENKDINQERMGMLRSSDFILGGSGWISFKLGGGKNTGTAYLSIKETETDIEIARYGNRHFANTALSSTSNAEAYLFQYYADLSYHLGKSLYFLITDGASHEWSVLAVDSLISYYENVPLASDDQLAHDIKPNIYNANNADNQISNNLTSNITNWEDPHSILQWNSNRARTNKQNGDNDLGVIRSPAFTINRLANTHLYFEWEGNIALDKQLFASIKEVGTNIELLRLVRRDNLSTKNSGGLDKHHYDLSILDETKQYYVEFVDNAVDGWGLISINNVYLLPYDDNRVSVSSDEAVNIYYGLSHVNTNNGGHRQYAENFTYFGGITAFNIATTFGEDPTKQMRINYHSYQPNTYIQIDDKNGWSMDVTPVCRQSSLQGYGQRYICTVNLDDLNSDTTYSYAIHRGSLSGKTYQFSTLNDDSLQFIFITDTQAVNWQTSSIYGGLLDQALTIEQLCQFVAIAGDLVELGGNNKMWEWYFETASRFNSLPMNTIPGNHDYYVNDGNLDSNIYYEQHFNNPDNGPSISTNSSYYYVSNDTLFISLDAVSDNYGESIIAWFNDVVHDNPTSFIIVMTHYSAYGAHHQGTAEQFLDIWGPIFDHHQVDIVLSGHDHVYARTPLMYDKALSIDPNIGTIYLTGGSASNKIYTVAESLKANYAHVMDESKNIFTIVTIKQGMITFTAFDINGQIEDTFTIFAKDRS
jgi:hypothetical protein